MRRGQSDLTLPLALLLVTIAFAAYFPATSAGFIWDDDVYVQNNSTLRSADGLRQIWFELRATPQYYPMVHSTYWIEYRLWGSSPAGYHLVNILLHVLGSLLLWRVLLLVRLPAAWFAAAIFALHPVHVESVAWITERKNVLSGVFYLASALLYLRFALGDGRVSRKTYFGALLLFVCALLSKTVACSLPAVLWLVLWWKRERWRWKDGLSLLPFFVVGIGLGLLTVWLEKYHVGAVGEEWNLSAIERCLIAGRALWFYVGKLIWPAELVFIYPRWTIDAGAAWQYVFPAAWAALIVALWILKRRIGRGPLTAVLIFSGTLVPALGFFDVYPMRFSFVADHFQYLASIGLIVLFAAGSRWALGRLSMRSKRTTWACAGIVLIALGALTWRQTRAYANLETLYGDTIRRNPKAWMAHLNLGLELERQGRLGDAITHYRESLEINPELATAHNALGVAVEKTGAGVQALDHFRQALILRPEYAIARYNLANTLRSMDRTAEAIEQYRKSIEIDPGIAMVHSNLGTALKSRGEFAEAAVAYRRALELNPGLAIVHHNLGNALGAMGDFDDATEHFRRALAIEPERADTLGNLGFALLQQGRLEAALQPLRMAIRLDADRPRALYRAAWILATHPDARIRSGAEAVALAERACTLTRNQDASALDALAAAYAEIGSFDRAVAVAQMAADRSRALDLPDVQARLALYEQGKPFRSSEGKR